MNIIMLTASMCGGGTERVISVLANDMVQKGLEVTILMTAGNEVVYELNQNIRIEALGNRTGGSIMKRLIRIQKIRKHYKEDRSTIVISFGMETNLFAVLAGIGLKNKIILSERNDPNQCNFKLLRNILYRLADGFVFQTKEAKEYFCKSIRNKGVVIPNPIKESLVMPYMGKREEVIATVGRLQPQKNHALLIHAFADFQKSHPTYRLLIYGKGELETSLRELAEELGVKDKVIFAGFVEDAINQIRKASMFVLSSDYEGISNSLMEAMAIGMPVISTDCPIGGSALLIKNKENGLLVPVGDKRALTDAMIHLADDELYAARMAQKACRIRQEYSGEEVCTKWITFIQRIGK